MRKKSIQNWLSGVSLAVIVTMAAPALAQNAQSPAPAAKETVDAEELVVTASRVARTGFTAPTPTTVIGAQQIQARAAVNVADVLNEAPSFRATSTATSGQVGGNFGANYLDLRGLNTAVNPVNPTARTLVLVDGHRFIPATTTGQVDINLIPTSLIDRTEVVTGGASASWGSDAIAGVVNVILKKQIEGIQGAVSGGMTDHGYRKSYNINLAAGTSFLDGRGHLTFGGEYDHADPLPDAQDFNSYTRESWGIIQNLPTTRAAGVPQNVIDKGFQYGSGYYAGGIITGGPLAGTAFNPNGTTFQFTRGTISTGQTQFGGTNLQGLPSDISFTTDLPVANGLDRWTTMVRADLELSSHATLFAEFTEAMSKQDVRYAGRVLTATVAPISVSIDNPFMPAAFRQQMVNAGLTTASFNRWDKEIGRNRQHNEREVQRGLIGIRGDLGGSWNYDAYYQKGATRSYFDIENMVDNANYLAAIDAVAGPNGTVVCRSLSIKTFSGATLQADPGCVPYNVFGQGSPSAAAVNYVTGHQFWHTYTNQQVAAANLRGDPITLPAGPVSIAVGVEWRRESARVVSDPKSQALRWDLNNQQPISGAYTVKEAYGEVVVPLLKDAAFIHTAELSGAIRRTDYSTSGTVTTWKVGGTFEDSSEQIRLRGTYSRDIRAPNLLELYGAKSFGIATIANLWANTAGVLTNVTTSGNLLLKPERAKTWTVGTVLSPKFVPNLRLSVDYYNITIDGVVAAIQATDVVQRCFNGQEDLCQYITWANPADRKSAILSVAANPVNLQQMKTSGVDIEAAYRTPVGNGNLGVRALATYVPHFFNGSSFGGKPVDVGGSRDSVPHWSYNLAIDYSTGRFSTNISTRIIGKQLYNVLWLDPSDPGYNAANANTVNRNHIPAVAYLNIGAQYDLIKDGDRKLTLFGVVNNLTNQMPPDGIGFTGGNTTYDLIGRFIRVGARFKY